MRPEDGGSEVAQGDSLQARPLTYGEGGRGVLLIHGFTGSPTHMKRLAEGLHNAGYTVRAPLLPGHGTSVEAMANVNWRDWLDACRAEYTRLRAECEFVCVSGLSMGGALAVLLAAQYPVDALVTMDTPVIVWDVLSHFAPLLAPFLKRFTWRGHHYPPEYDFLYEDDVGYDGAPVTRVSDLNRIIRMAKRNFFAVTAPALIMQGLQDKTVVPRSANLIYDGVSSARKELLWLPNSPHVCTLGPDRALILERFAAFLDSVSRPEPAKG